MKPFERLILVQKIAQKLHSSIDHYQIQSYLQEYGITLDDHPEFYSVEEMVNRALINTPVDVILEIADELKIDYEFKSNPAKFNETIISFWKSGHFRLFISHLATFKEKVVHLKYSLEKYGISSFVAHEDIEPSREWQVEIEKGLFSMDAMCVILMPGFKESNWTDQEIGVALGRSIPIIPVRRGLDPYGFIGKYQGFQALGKSVDEVAEAIFTILSKNLDTRNRMIDCLIDLLLLAKNKKEAIERISALLKMEEIPKERVQLIRERFTENTNLSEPEIISMLNNLLRKYEIEDIDQLSFEKKADIRVDDLPF
jgi:TIR domain